MNTLAIAIRIDIAEAIEAQAARTGLKPEYLAYRAIGESIADADWLNELDEEAKAAIWRAPPGVERGVRERGEAFKSLDRPDSGTKPTKILIVAFDDALAQRIADHAAASGRSSENVAASALEEFYAHYNFVPLTADEWPEIRKGDERADRGDAALAMEVEAALGEFRRTNGLYDLTPEQWAEIEMAIEEADRGDIATPEEVESALAEFRRTDWFDDLDEEAKAAVREGLADIERGAVYKHEAVFEDLRRKHGW